MSVDDKIEVPQTIFSFTETQGEGSLNASPEKRAYLQRLLNWKKESENARWIPGRPYNPY